MNVAISLETVAVGFAGFCCMFYGVLGISTICTSDCSSIKVDERGQKVSLTPLMASFYCSLALIAGFFLFRLRNTVGQLAGGISTFGSSLRTVTPEGQEMRTFSIRFAVILTFAFVVVVGFMNMVLLGPLKKCVDLTSDQVPFMFAIRSALEKMEHYMVWGGFGLLGAGLLFSVVETLYREGHAKKVAKNEDTEDYGWTDAVSESAEKNWKWLFGSKDSTLKSTGQSVLAPVHAVNGSMPHQQAQVSQQPQTVQQPQAVQYAEAQAGYTHYQRQAPPPVQRNHGKPGNMTVLLGKAPAFFESSNSDGSSLKSMETSRRTSHPRFGSRNKRGLNSSS